MTGQPQQTTSALAVAAASGLQGAHLGGAETRLVTEYMDGGDLLHNIAAGRVSWYRRGKKVSGHCCWGPAAMLGALHRIGLD